MTDYNEHGIDELKRFAMGVVQKAGEMSMDYYGRGKPDVKFDEGLVTEAELRLTEFFQQELHTQFPEHLIFMNDHTELEYTHEERKYLWIFDALDGVANFQAGIPIWGISLAVLENFWPVFGVCHMPATGDLFYAQAGDRAFWDKKQIHVTKQDNMDDESLLLTYSRFHQQYSSTFPGKIRNLGCSMAHICYVATGCAEAAVVANVSYQDLAAALLINEAAGGKTYQMEGGEFFLNEYLDGKRIDDHLLVTASRNFKQIRRCLKKNI